jgi:hypothetical protein
VINFLASASAHAMPAWDLTLYNEWVMVTGGLLWQLLEDISLDVVAMEVRV